MEQNNEIKEQSGDQTVSVKDAPVVTPSPGNGRTKTTISPQTDGGSCPTCGGGANSTPPSYVYALGRIEARFPRLSVEKEFAQATRRAEDTTGKTNQEVFHKVFSERQNRYLARQMCWVLTIEHLETYILVPRDPADIDLLIEAIRPAPSPLDMDIVIGVRGPIAPPEMCNGLMVPIVVFDQIYSFDRVTFIKSIPRPKETGAKDYTKSADGALDTIMQMADNAGATDEHRALNYCVVRYPKIYETVADAHGRNSSLTAVEVRSSPLSSTRKIVEVIISFTNRNTDVTEKYFARVDVTEEFPFLVTKMSPYYDR